MMTSAAVREIFLLQEKMRKTQAKPAAEASISVRTAVPKMP